jgi:hypothetical protein
VNASTLEKRALQLAVSIAAALPVFAGAWDAFHHLTGASAWAANHERYLSGLLLAIGLGFWSTVPDIEGKRGRFRLLTFIVVVGGACRLLGVLMGDPPSPQVIAALLMELGITPALCLWQSRLMPQSIRRANTAPFLPQFDS